MEQLPDVQPVLHFPEGIPGFPSHRRFLLVEFGAETAFQLLQSVDDPDIAMVVVAPWLLFPDYAPDLPELECEELGLERPEDAVVFCPVTLAPEDETVYVNLLGPFVVNSRTHEGRQVVLAESDLPLRARVQVG